MKLSIWTRLITTGLLIGQLVVLSVIAQVELSTLSKEVKSPSNNSGRLTANQTFPRNKLSNIVVQKKQNQPTKQRHIFRKGRIVDIDDDGIENNDSFRNNHDTDAQLSAPDASEEQQQQQQQQPVQPKEGVMQMKRAARNVERKMDLISGRVDQIQSQIAEDHQQQVPSAAYSTPFNELHGEPSNSAQDNGDSLQQGAEQSDQQPASDWSRTQTGSNQPDQAATGANRTSGQPSIQQQQQQATIRSYLPSSSNSNVANPSNTDGALTLSSMGQESLTSQQQRPTVGDQEQPIQSSEMIAGGQNGSEGSNNNYLLGLVAAAAAADHQPAESAAQVASDPSWTENHQFFNALNDQNHNQQSRASGFSSRGQPAAIDPAHFADPDDRFKNMTVVNSATDLINSYSTQQHHTTPDQMAASSTTVRQQQAAAAAAAATSNSSSSYNGDGSHKQQAAAPITTYRVNYGKSSSSKKGHRQSSSSSHHSPQLNESNQATNEQLAIQKQQQQQQMDEPVKWPQLATVSSYARTNENSNFYSPATTLTPASESGGLYNQAQSSIRDQVDRPMLASSSSNSERLFQGGKYATAANSPRVAADRATSSQQQQQQRQQIYSIPDERFANSKASDLKHRSSHEDDANSVTLSLSSSQEASINGGQNNPENQQGNEQQPQLDAADNLYYTSNNDEINRDRQVLLRMNQPSQTAGGGGSSSSRGLSSQGATLAGGGQQNEFGNNNNNNNNDQVAAAAAYSQQMAANGQDRQDWPDQIQGQQQQQQHQSFRQPLDEPSLQSNDFRYPQFVIRGRQEAATADSMQPAATGGGGGQQQPQQAAIYPSLAEMNSLLRRYQLQQQQQQQQLQQQNRQENSLLAANLRDNSDQQLYNSALRRLWHNSLDRAPSTQMMTSMMDNSLATNTNELTTNTNSNNAYNSQPQQQTYYYSPYSHDSRSILSTNNLAAYYKALAAATRVPEYATAAQRASYLSSAAAQASHNSQNQNYLYAAAAMNTPAFSDAPSQQQQQQQLRATQTQAGQQQQQLDQAGEQPAPATIRQSGNQKRAAHLSGIFRPSASSRYFAGPGLLTLSPGAYQTLHAPAASVAAAAAASVDPMQSALQQLLASAASNQYWFATPGGGGGAGALSQPGGSPSAASIEQGQQYQSLAGQNHLIQPGHHYIGPDTEMAESSLVASDPLAFAAPATPYMIHAAQYPSMSSAIDTSASSSSSSSGGGGGGGGGSGSSQSDQVGSSQESKGKGLSSWTNIAGLLLGVLPFGMMMALLLPGMTLTARKKRELEIGGRNFSELLKWRPPSIVLEALKSQQDPSKILTNLIGQLFSSGSDQPRAASSRLIDSDHDQRHSRRRSLQSSLGAGPRGSQVTVASGVDSGELVKRAPDVLNSTSIAANSTNGDHANGASGQLEVGGAIRARVKKALSAWNNLMSTAAQNMKRKHRSSIMDSQWVSPLAALRSSLRLDNLFNLDELKRLLASVIQAKAIAAQNQIAIQQRQQAELLKKYLLKANLTLLQVPQPQPQPVAQVQQQAAGKNMSIIVTETPPPTTNKMDPFGVQSPEPASTKSAPQRQPVVALASINAIAEPLPPQSRLEASLVVADGRQPQAPLAASDSSVEVMASKQLVNDSSKYHLETCLNQFLCRLTVKLDKTLRNIPTSAQQYDDAPSQAAATTTSTTRPPRNSTQQLSAEQLERITKRYINQLVEQIEAEHPSLSLSVGRQKQGMTSANSLDNSLAGRDSRHPTIVGTTVNDSAIDVLYKNAMQNQCSLVYNCVELMQLERMLTKMKLKFS